MRPPLVHLERVHPFGLAVFRHVARLATLQAFAFELVLAFSSAITVALLRTLRLSFADTVLSLAALGRSVALFRTVQAHDLGVVALLIPTVWKVLWTIPSRTRPHPSRLPFSPSTHFELA